MARSARGDDSSGGAPGGIPGQIATAFAEAPYPGDHWIVEEPSDWEGSQIREAFKGLHWSTIPTDVLSRNYASLTYFTPEAYRFYLPAYLLAALDRRPDASDVPATGYGIKYAVLSSLIPPKLEGPAMDKLLRRMKGLTAEQRAAIRDFLHWLVRKEKKRHVKSPSPNPPLSLAEIALNRYWSDQK